MDDDRFLNLCLNLVKGLKRNTKIYLAPFGVRENILKSLSLGVNGSCDGTQEASELRWWQNLTTLSLVTVGQSPWDDIKILEWGLGHLISEF